MIVFSLSVLVPAADQADFLSSVGALLEPTRVVPDCIACRLYADIEDPNAFTLVEEWGSQAALDRHLTSSAYKTLVAAIELSARPPTIHFDRVEQRAGIEVIAAARHAQGLLSLTQSRSSSRPC
ncbi:antibiotic biosynthesis monooxygenase [uncultured Thiodictyon sp.]|uniref:putative quinol monooxygenase n=1 Tax=uncultured Thiodictyon sp. TaxID=1846217 RepID=UPI0025F6AFEB|nr:antibiotic biosynthesis monooxygenase [uncultured Thiodictyon sp.]